MNVKHSLTASVVLALLVAGSAFAQEELRPGPPSPCPHPVSLVIGAPPPTPPTPDPADFTGTLAAGVAGSVWNQTAINKAFGHTFHFPFPGQGQKECCLMTKGTLTVTVKCLQEGAKGSATSANDDAELIHNGVAVPGQAQKPWLNGCKTGQTATLTFNAIPASVLSTGRVSLYVEDDTAVLSTKLALEGCCIP